MGKGYSKPLGRRLSLRSHGGESSQKEVEELEEVKQGMTANWPDDVLIDILIKLPAKSLARFKCVSRNWCSLIHDKAFVYSHLALASERTMEFLVTLDPNKVGWFRSYAIDDQGFRMELHFRVTYSHLPISSCHGLLCFAESCGVKLCNPLTGETMTISNPSCFRKCLVGKLMTGFGFDTSSEKYKVVCCANLSTEVEVLTLGCLHSTWRCIKRPLGLQIPLEKSTYANGNLYWITASIIDAVTGSKSCMILTFNLSNEEFRLLSGPDENFQGYKYWLSAMHCYLCVVQAHCNGTVNLWILKDGWVKKNAFQLPFPPVNQEDFMTVRNNKVLFRSSEDNCSYICHYDEQGQLLKVIKVEGLPSFLKHYMGYYVESLVSLRYISEFRTIS